MQTDKHIRDFIHPRDVRQLPMAAMHGVMAMRLCVICHRVGHDPAHDLLQRFGNELATNRFQVIFEVIGKTWPDPFTVSRACCPLLTPDESMFANMMIAACNQDRAAFDFETSEMFGSDARGTLFAALSAFERARMSETH